MKITIANPGTEKTIDITPELLEKRINGQVRFIKAGRDSLGNDFFINADQIAKFYFKDREGKFQWHLN